MGDKDSDTTLAGAPDAPGKAKHGAKRAANQSPLDDPARAPLLWRLLFILATVLGVGASAFAAWSESRTYDEPNHLAWSERLLDGRDISRDLAEWMISQTPMTLLNVLAGREGEQLLAERPQWEELLAGRNAQFLQRLATVSLFLLLILVTRRLGTAVAGPRAGILAGAATALDPNLIAHGSLVTVDVPFAFAATLTLFAAFRFGRSPTVLRAAMLGIAFGIAFTTKFTAMLLLAAVVGLPLLNAGRLRLSMRGFGRLLIGAAVAVVWAVLVIDAAYLFRHVGVPLSEIPFRTPLFQRIATQAGSLPMPFPKELLTGIDRCMYAEQKQAWNAVILDRFSTNGFWYYFPALFLMKTPVFMLVSLVFGIGAAIRSGAVANNRALLWLTLSLAVFLGYFCVLFKVQVGYRYVLFCLPLLFILAAAGWVRLLAPATRRLAPVFVLGASLVELAPYATNPISFSNLFIQPKSQAFRYIADSNLDWAQTNDAVHNAIRETGLRRASLNPSHILPGWNVITANWLSGVIWNRPQYRWVRNNLSPDFVLGDTAFVYYISRSTFDRFLLSERTLPATLRTDVICDESNTIHDGTAQTLAISTPTLKCIETEGATIRLSQLSGTVIFGPKDPMAGCRTDYIQLASESWYRLEKGRYPFCFSATAPQTAELDVMPFVPQRAAEAPPAATPAPAGVGSDVKASS